MEKKYYDSLPAKFAERAEQYLDLAHELAEKKFSAAKVGDEPLLTIQLAAAMMNLEAAEVMAAEQERIAEKIEEKA